MSPNAHLQSQSLEQRLRCAKTRTPVHLHPVRNPKSPILSLAGLAETQCLAYRSTSASLAVFPSALVIASSTALKTVFERVLHTSTAKFQLQFSFPDSPRLRDKGTSCSHVPSCAYSYHPLTRGMVKHRLRQAHSPLFHKTRP